MNETENHLTKFSVYH